jgi:hypothetical protein
MSFRALDIAGYTPCAIADQPAPVMDWVELDRCVIDGRYQRDITPAGRRAIQRIAEGWSWSKYQPILCAATADGRFAIVDGQHRAHAALVAGLGRLPALIVPMTPVQQAAAFGAVNRDRVKLSPAAIYKAQLAAGDEGAFAAAAAVEAAGCRLMTYNPSAAERRPGDVFAYGLIQRMVAEGEGAAVTVGLRAIRESAVGNAARDDNYNTHLRVYDSAILSVWLPALASNQRFLRLPDLAGLFGDIDWDGEFETARAWARRNGGAVRPNVARRVEAILRAAVQGVAA